jgi:hypothetical protein
LNLGAKVLARVESGACSEVSREIVQNNRTKHYSIADDKTPIEYVCNFDASFDKQMGITNFGGSNN